MIAKSFTETLPHGPSFDMVFIEGGEFLMGAQDNDPDASSDERPLHRVQLDSFFMGKFQVTQAVWEAVMGYNPSYFIGPRRPVENISWDDVVDQFLPRLNEFTGRAYRLPTEAEWEYAARGGQNGEGYRYAGSGKLVEVGWFIGNEGKETREVGLQYSNELGLYDMCGNVWEWCTDWYDEDYYKACAESGTVVNPFGATGGNSRVVRGGIANRWGADESEVATGGDTRVVRGGSYFSSSVGCRPADRSNDSPDYRRGSIGLRLVLPFQSGG